MRAEPAESELVIVVAPFASLKRPSLAAGLLAAIAHREGFATTVEYTNLRFARVIGAADYEAISDVLPGDLLLGEWLFAEAAFGERPDASKYVDLLLERMPKERLPRDRQTSIDWLTVVSGRAATFCTAMAERIVNTAAQLVCFTSTFQQTCASIGVAREIRRLAPGLTLAAGGANFETTMGRELWCRLPWFDYVCLGEGEQSLIDLATAVVRERRRRPVVGCVGPRGAAGPTEAVRPVEPLLELDSLPVPDYSSYFDSLRALDLRSHVHPVLVMETSRGCWWGRKRHCTFCGIRDKNFVFRVKSHPRAAEELEELIERYQCGVVSMADLILPTAYAGDFFWGLGDQAERAQIFYEVKANLSRAQVRRLHAGGVRWIQPGIESLSTEALGLLRKGVTALQNIALLKWCQEIGTRVYWNFLVKIPNERDSWYEGVLDLIPAIEHLMPPETICDVRLDRFSPYFDQFGDFWIKCVRPCAAYGHVFPFDREGLEQVAYYFDHEVSICCSSEMRRRLVRAIELWRGSARGGRGGSLWGVAAGRRKVVVRDTRRIARDEWVGLEGVELEIVRASDGPRSVGGIVGRLKSEGWEAGEIERGIAELERRRFVVREGERIVSVVCLVAEGQLPEFSSGSPGGWIADVNPDMLRVPPNLDRVGVGQGLSLLGGKLEALGIALAEAASRMKARIFISAPERAEQRLQLVDPADQLRPAELSAPG